VSHRPQRQSDKVIRASAFVVRNGTIGGELARGARNGMPPGTPYVWRGDTATPEQLAAQVREQLNPVRLALVCYADGRPVPGVQLPAWLASYDPEGHNGRGRWKWTSDPQLAMVLPTPQAAHRLWTAVPKARPRRPWDNRPNRPLTQFTVVIEQVPEVPLDLLPPGPAGGD